MKTLMISFAIVAALSTALAYDFEDTYFNQILARDLQDLHAFYDEPNFPSHRTRRDAEVVPVPEKCHPLRYKVCCAEESLEGAYEKGKELKRQCFKELAAAGKELKLEFDPFRCTKTEQFKKEITCLAECVGKKKAIVDAEGNIIEEATCKMAKKLMEKEAWFQPIQDKVIDKCVALARNATAKRDTSDPTACNPAALKIVYCLYREIQLSCPADQIKDQEVCDRVKEKIKVIDSYHAQNE